MEVESQMLADPEVKRTSVGISWTNDKPVMRHEILGAFELGSSCANSDA